MAELRTHGCALGRIIACANAIALVTARVVNDVWSIVVEFATPTSTLGDRGGDFNLAGWTAPWHHGGCFLRPL